jgi:beta-lactam-binding protein with PASTA domain
VRGRQLGEAQAKLKQAGLFQPGTTVQKCGTETLGTVVEQEPQQNYPAPRNSPIKLTVTTSRCGQASNDNDENFNVQMPSLLRLTPNQASDRLEPFKLALNKVTEGDGSGNAGTIYNQSPQANSLVKAGERVEVWIVEQKASGGKGGVVWAIVPDLRGQTENRAKELIRESFLSLGSVTTGNSPDQAGTVFWQSPPKNQKVPQGTPVSMNIAQAVPPRKPAVIVPNLVGKNIDDAKALLAQVGLPLGDVKREENDAYKPNLVTYQSPDAKTPVVGDTPVNVLIAQEVPLVKVPNLVQHDEADSVTILDNAGLQRGAVNEKDDEDATSGTVLSQSPQAGQEVRKGSTVDEIVSRQVTSPLTVMVDQTNPKRGEPLGFHAHMESPSPGMQYRFSFGDDQESGPLTDSRTTHTYEKSGDFHVQAFAVSGNTTIASAIRTVTIPGFPLAMVTTLTVGVLALGGAGFLYRGWKLFHQWIQVAPKMDMGTQELSIGSSDGWNQRVQVRVVQDVGECHVLWPGGEQPRKAGIK